MTAIALKLSAAITAPRIITSGTRLRRRTLAQRLEMAGVLMLMGSSAGYAVFTLLHLA